MNVRGSGNIFGEFDAIGWTAGCAEATLATVGERMQDWITGFSSCYPGPTFWT